MAARFDLMARRNSAATHSWDTEVTVRAGDAGSSANLVADLAGNVMGTFSTDNSNFNSARWEVKTGQWNTLLGFVNDSTSLNGDLPELAVDAAGNVFAVWAFNGKTFANRFDVASARWQGVVAIRSSADATFGTSNAHIAAGSNGLALATWFETSDTLGAEVGANAWDPTLGGWRSTMPDEPKLRLGDGTQGGVVADPLGGFYMFWSDHIYTFDANATMLSAPIPVGRDGSLNLVDDAILQLGIDSNGARVAAWAQNATSNPDIGWSASQRATTGVEVWQDITLLGAKLPPPGQSLLTDGYPSMSVGSPGTALITWSQALTSDAVPATSVHAKWIKFGASQ